MRCAYKASFLRKSRSIRLSDFSRMKPGRFCRRVSRSTMPPNRGSFESEAARWPLPALLITAAPTAIARLPLVIAKGHRGGAGIRIGQMLVSSMIVGTLFTLLVVPSIYMPVARKREGAAPPEVIITGDDQ